MSDAKRFDRFATARERACRPEVRKRMKVANASMRATRHVERAMRDTMPPTPPAPEEVGDDSPPTPRVTVDEPTSAPAAPTEDAAVPTPAGSRKGKRS